MKISNVTVRRRLFIALIIAVASFALLIGRLAYVQLWKGEELASKAENSWRREIPFSAKRGEIWDRNGTKLAYNISSPTIMAIPAQIKDAQKTAAELARVLDMTEDAVLTTITKKQLIVRIQPGGRKITTDKAQLIRDLALPGVVVAEDNKRYYPMGSFASHVLGFTGIDNQGLTGIEAQYNDMLSGINGNISFLSDAKGRQMPGSADSYLKPKDGLNLELTLDKQIQSIMERELDQAMVKFQADDIMAIAMDPSTGEILGMASRPTYEPDKYRDVDPQVYNRNLPIWMTYEPGSTFKIITLSAALEEGKVNLTNDHFYDPGFVEVGGARLRCWKKGGHGSQTFLEVVQNSCNPGFVALGNRLGKDKLFQYIKDFGFGTKTGIDLGGEEN
ncbi:stage V sporulation protein D, partial [Paenibacillus sepulcri]|nr:stage V sporulation protein D [Paenibacillus sepulcri]